MRNFVQGQTYYLAGSGVTLTATTISLQSMEYPDGTLVAMADFGDLGYITLEPETEREENASFTNLTQNADGSVTLTGVTRGLAFKTPYTQDLALRQDHAGNTEVRVTNSAPFYNQLAVKENDESITGQWEFPSTEADRPRNDADTDTAVLEALVTFGQLGRTAFAGVTNASTVAKGIVQEATQAQTDARTQTGSTGADLFLNPLTLRASKYHDLAAASGGTDAYAITPTPAVTALADGQVFVFEADVANTGACTLNVATLGAKAIKKYGSKDLETNDIVAGSIVTVIYDLDSDTYMLQTPVAKQQVSQDGAEIFALDVGATDAYAITLSPAITAYTNGQRFYFGVNTANTGPATLNVNAVGAKAIKKNYDEDLITGDLVVGQYVEVAYDSANDTFQLQSPVNPFVIPQTIVAATRAENTASGSQAIAHGLGRVPKRVTFFANIDGVGTTSGTSSSSQGFSDGTNNFSVFNQMNASGGSIATVICGNDATNCIHLAILTNVNQVASAAVDATNVTLTWTLTGAPGGSADMNILMLVE
jgi:hypothetical protein